MKPKTAARKISNVLWNQFIEKKELEIKSYAHIKDRLKSIEPELIKLHELSKRYDDDSRSGAESYGYRDMESTLGNLEYISDRWRCRFRIRWLLDLIKLGDTMSPVKDN